MQAQNKTNAALSELCLMSANVQTLAFHVAQDRKLLETAAPIKKQVAAESADILESLRVLCKSMQKALESGDDVSHEKALAKSISQTSENAQIFYLLSRMANYEDDTLKAKAAAATRRMQSSVVSMIALCPAAQGDDDAELKKESENLAVHLQGLLDFSTSAIGPAKPVKQLPGVQMTDIAKQQALTRLNAEAEVHKRRYALEEAEAEVKRLEALSQAK
jgi:hypothetical protein